MPRLGYMCSGGMGGDYAGVAPFRDMDVKCPLSGTSVKGAVDTPVRVGVAAKVGILGVPPS